MSEPENAWARYVEALGVDYGAFLNETLKATFLAGWEAAAPLHPRPPRCRSTVNDGDVRPAGPAGECFYCRQPIGEQHGHDCVIPRRLVVLRAIIEFVADEPEEWTAEQITFHRNESSWCADNVLDDVAAPDTDNTCICSRCKIEYVREATVRDVEDMPRRNA